MAQRTLATLGTGAVTDTNQTPFTIKQSAFRRNMQPVLAVKGLAGAETADLWIRTGDVWGEVTDSSGTQIQFTATVPAVNIGGPGEYGFTKSSSVGGLTVYVNDGT